MNFGFDFLLFFSVVSSGNCDDFELIVKYD